MTESPEKSILAEERCSPLTAERNTETARPDSPMSGGSDNDGAERPVRERLKKASIAGLSTHGQKGEGGNEISDGANVASSTGQGEKGPEDAMSTDETSPLRGRSTRKRSFDDLQNESITGVDTPGHDGCTQTWVHHKRMRSRDMASSQTAAGNGRVDREQVEALAEEEDDLEAQKSPGGAGVMVKATLGEDDDAVSGNQSPKKKRSRDQFDKDHTPEGDALEQDENHAVSSEGRSVETEEAARRAISNGDKGEPNKKRHRDGSQEGTEAVDTEHATTKVWTRYAVLVGHRCFDPC